MTNDHNAYCCMISSSVSFMPFLLSISVTLFGLYYTGYSYITIAYPSSSYLALAFLGDYKASYLRLL